MKKTTLAQGIEHVDANEDQPGLYLYWEQGTARWYRDTGEMSAGWQTS